MTRTSIFILLLASAGCRSDAFDTAELEVRRAQVSLTLRGPTSPPCPALEDGASARIGGVDASVVWPGGVYYDDEQEDGCDAAMLGADGLTFDGGVVEVEVVSEAWPIRFQVVWPQRFEYWTDDDLAAARRSGALFEVHWVPTDAAPPQLSAHNRYGELDTRIELVDATAGSARFHFVAGVPTTEWWVVAKGELVREPIDCEGVATCRAVGIFGERLTDVLAPEPLP